MAKKSMRNRDIRRAAISNKYAKLRSQLKTAVVDMNLSDQDREAARIKLQGLPRDASPCRMRTRCQYGNCGRPRGVYRLTGLCRIHTRHFAMKGHVPGLVKSSW